VFYVLEAVLDVLPGNIDDKVNKYSDDSIFIIETIHILIF
jgi:hypothetical protein